MTARIIQDLEQARSAILAGRPDDVMRHLDRFADRMRQTPPGETLRGDIGGRLDELRKLALASQRGAQDGADQIRAILAAARSLQSYDETGRRQVTSIVAMTPQRF